MKIFRKKVDRCIGISKRAGIFALPIEKKTFFKSKTERACLTADRFKQQKIKAAVR